jgi:hypothetical protein
LLLLALHTPPGTASLRFTLELRITLDGPVIVPGIVVFTVTICTAEVLPQPLVTAYDIVAVPEATPVTLPVEPTAAIPVDTELQIPPPAPSVKLVVAPTHTVAVPLMLPALGTELTVTTTAALALPQPLVRV